MNGIAIAKRTVRTGIHGNRRLHIDIEMSRRIAAAGVRSLDRINARGISLNRRIQRGGIANTDCRRPLLHIAWVARGIDIDGSAFTDRGIFII